jgi:hypothetical protein
MPIAPKPFNISEKIRRRIFKPKPNIYSDVDINQETEAIVDAVERIASRLGSVTENLSVTVNTLQLTKSGGIYTLNYDISLGGNGQYYYGKTVRFDLPNASFASAMAGLAGANPGELPTVTIYLIAKVRTVTFAQDPVMSGIDVGFPLASSDTIQWYGERLAKSENGVLPTLSPDEVLIGKVLSVGYEDVSYTGNPNDYVASLIYEAPDLASITDYIRGFYMGTDSVNSVYEMDGRQWLKIKELNDKVAIMLPITLFFDINSPSVGDMLLYTDVGGSFKFRKYTAVNLIRTIDHAMQALFSYKYANIGGSPTGYYFSSPNNIKITAGNNNTFEVQVPTNCTILDIIMYRIPPVGPFPAFDVPMPSGTVVHLSVSSTNDTPVFGGNIASIIGGGAFTAIGKWSMFKIPTGWLVTGAPDIINRKFENLRNYLEGVWDTATGSMTNSGGNISGTQTLIRYKKIGKTLFFHVTLIFTTSGNVNSITADFSSVFQNNSSLRWSSTAADYNSNTVECIVKLNTSSGSFVLSPIGGSPFPPSATLEYSFSGVLNIT